MRRPQRRRTMRYCFTLSGREMAAWYATVDAIRSARILLERRRVFLPAPRVPLP